MGASNFLSIVASTVGCLRCHECKFVSMLESRHSFSRHGRCQASWALLIRLIDSVHTVDLEICPRVRKMIKTVRFSKNNQSLMGKKHLFEWNFLTLWHKSEMMLLPAEWPRLRWLLFGKSLVERQQQALSRTLEEYSL